MLAPWVSTAPSAMIPSCERAFPRRGPADAGERKELGSVAEEEHEIRSQKSEIRSQKEQVGSGRVPRRAGESNQQIASVSKCNIYMIISIYLYLLQLNDYKSLSWSKPGDYEFFGASANDGNLHLLTSDFWLLSFDSCYPPVTGQFNSRFPREGDGFLIACIDVAGHADAGIVGQHAV